MLTSFGLVKFSLPTAHCTVRGTRRRCRCPAPPGFDHEVVVKPQVVLHKQTLRQHFTRLEQMAHIGAGEPPAGRALASLFNRAVIGLVFGVVDVQDSVPSEQMPMARIARRHDAVEEIHAARHALNDVGRRANAHQIARLILRRIRQHLVEDVVHHLGALSNRQSADGVARKIQFCDILHMLNTQIIIGTALIDAKQQLLRVDRIGQAVETRHLLFAALKPTGCARTRCLDVIIWRRIFNAFIKCHGNIRAEIGLDAHALLRPHENLAAVYMRVEEHALLP